MPGFAGGPVHLPICCKHLWFSSLLPVRYLTSPSHVKNLDNHDMSHLKSRKVPVLTILNSHDFLESILSSTCNPSKVLSIASILLSIDQGCF